MSTDATREPRPTIVIKTIEGRRSDRRPVLPQAKYDAQVKVLESRGAKSPISKSGR